MFLNVYYTYKELQVFILGTHFGGLCEKQVETQFGENLLLIGVLKLALIIFLSYLFRTSVMTSRGAQKPHISC